MPRQKGRQEREIEQLVQQWHQPRKCWRKANQNEREDLKVLWTKIRQRLANLWRAERIRRRQKRREKEQAKLFKNPFRFARQLLEKAKPRSLEVTREDMEEHIKRQYNDEREMSPLVHRAICLSQVPPCPSLTSSRQSSVKSKRW